VQAHPRPDRKVAHKNAITRAVGVYERVEIDTLLIELLPGDQFPARVGRPSRVRQHARRAHPLPLRNRWRRCGSSAHRVRQRSGRKDNITASWCASVRVRQAIPSAPRTALKREVSQRCPFSRAFRARDARVAGRRSARLRRCQEVISRGDRGDELFTVLSGKVRCYAVTPRPLLRDIL